MKDADEDLEEADVALVREFMGAPQGMNGVISSSVNYRLSLLSGEGDGKQDEKIPRGVKRPFSQIDSE